MIQCTGSRRPATVVVAVLLVAALAGCSPAPTGRGEPAGQGTPTGQDSPGAGAAPSSAVPRPADLDLSGVREPCATWGALDGTTIGMVHPEAADDWTDGYWELLFPGARVAACGWIDGYPDDPAAGADPTDIGFTVGAVVGTGLDAYLEAGEDPTWTAEDLTVEGYRARGALRTETARACSVLVDVHDGQLLYVSWSRGGQFPAGTTFEQGCSDAADLARQALRVVARG
ncbi:DUF3558 family protein [Promicromonospora sukumoe]|uniref:DUF3558 family protein n=1 Tax=Promicromonospora sukumoe TaxID=88382 RepID=UPI0003687AEE|nr:DUF3558 family protein [Promicromonospora sukumoe]